MVFRVNVLNSSEMYLAFHLIVGGGERQLHRNDLMVGHAHLLHQQVADQARVADDQVQCLCPLWCVWT